MNHMSMDANAYDTNQNLSHPKIIDLLTKTNISNMNIFLKSVSDMMIIITATLSFPNIIFFV
jgi:L-rhamnose mutarotase